MKKLSKLSLKRVSEMTDEEMKLVVGGAGSGSCWVTCYSANGGRENAPDCSTQSQEDACHFHGGSTGTCVCP